MRSALGFDAADDPAYKAEFETLADLCRQFLAALAADDFDVALLVCGMLLAQNAVIYKLAPPADLFDPADLFRR